MGAFVTKCKGCGKLWAELTDDMMLQYRFRRVEAGKAAHSIEGMTFIEEHLRECPPDAPQMTRKKATAPAKEAKKKAQPSRAGQKETKKPATALPPKTSRDAVDKRQRRLKEMDDFGREIMAIRHANSKREMTVKQPGPPDQISTMTDDGNGDTAAAPSCSTPVDSTENSVEQPSPSGQISAATHDVDASMADAPSCSEPVGGKENGIEQPSQPGQISTATNAGDAYMADSPSCSELVDSMENSIEHPSLPGQISTAISNGDAATAAAPSSSNPVAGAEKGTNSPSKAAEPAGASPGQQAELSIDLEPSTHFPSDLPPEMASSPTSGAKAQAPGGAGGSPPPGNHGATAIGSSSGGDEDVEMENGLSNPASTTASTAAPSAPTPVPSSSGALAGSNRCIVL